MRHPWNEAMEPPGALSPKAQAAIDLVTQAARANVDDARRRGAIVELDAPGDCLVAGDLHGNLANFQRLVKAANLQRHQQRHMVVQELVHEVDNPLADLCLSYRLVEMAARLKATFPDRFHVILGNHELAELLDLGISKHRIQLNDAFDAGLERDYGDCWPAVKAAYKEFWRTSPLGVRTSNGFFISHSTPSVAHLAPFDLAWFHGLAPGEGRDRGSPVYNLVWDRDYSEDAAAEFARRVESRLLVVAHTPCEFGFQQPNSRTLLLDSKDQRACYALLPLDGHPSGDDLAGFVHELQRASPR